MLNKYKCWDSDLSEDEAMAINSSSFKDAAECFAEFETVEEGSNFEGWVQVKRVDMPELGERSFYVKPETTWIAKEDLYHE